MSENVIFCYSGTGNCLDMAKTIARELGDTDIILMRKEPVVTDVRDAKRVGFVFPCYGGGLPGGVEESLRKIQVGLTAYTFGVCQYAGYMGSGLYKLNSIIPLRADAESVFNAAKAFRLGDRSMLQKGGYIYRYPHQLGPMLYDCILMLFRADPAFNFVMNFVFVIGINHLSCKISDALFHDKAVNLLTIVCTFAFLPTVST